MTNSLLIARRARSYGARYSLRIVWEARRAGVRVSDAFALVEHESGFQNIFGHDWGHNPNTIPFPGAAVTKARVAELLAWIDRGGTSNGVGLTQLTYGPFVRQAQTFGGAHKPKYQLRVGLSTLAGNQRKYGRREGFRMFNGSGPAAERYADAVMARAAVWHTRLA